MSNKDRVWEDSQPRLFGLSVPDFEEQPLKPVPADCMPDEFVEELVRVSRIYAVRKGRLDLQAKITNNSLRTSMAVMFLTGYLTPSNRMLFWENRPDTVNMFVRRAISRNLFQIIKFTYFTDRVIPDPADRFWKVRSLFPHLNQTAKKFEQHPAAVSVDERMVKYFGPHPLKQFMRGKPVRFGYKVWILASPQGELLAVQPYAGASTNIEDFGPGQGPNVVMGLVQQYGLLPGAKVYVDNLFTSLDLLDHMGDMRLGVTGTFRQNRIVGIPLPACPTKSRPTSR
jgi:DNA excision repair protein ERCC-6